VPDNPYQRSIDTAANTLAAANADWDRINTAMEAIPASDKATGGPRENEYASLAKQLDAAAKRSATSEAAYQNAISDADKAAVQAKVYQPKGTTRDRLDTTSGNVLVTIREIADGQGGWTLDKSTPITKVDVQGAAGADDKITAAPTSRMILKNGVLVDNPAYDPPKPANVGGAVPTSEYVYDENGKPVKNPAYVPPKTPDEGLTTGQKATDAATAANAAATASANLTTLQTNADVAKANLEDAQRRARQAPSDAQAQQAIKNALDTAQTANDTAQQALAQAKALAPGAVAQQGATLASTQAATAASNATVQQGLQGPILYGLQDKIKQIHDLIAAGQMTPQDGDQMIAAAQRGTTPYEIATRQAADALTARGQDVTNRDSLASTYGTLMGGAGTMFGDLNKNGQPGSDASGRAYLAMMGMAQDYLKSQQVAPATPTDYLGTGPNPNPSPIGNMVSQAQQQLNAGGPAVATTAAAKPPPPAFAQTTYGGLAQGGANLGGMNLYPTPGSSGAPIGGLAQGGAAQGAQNYASPTTDSTGHTITINIGGTGAGTPAPVVAPGVAGTGLDPSVQPLQGFSNRTVGGAQDVYGSGPSNVSGLVRAASQAVPGTPADVAALYPNAAARHGVQY
jgi:hypothetical protein